MPTTVETDITVTTYGHELTLTVICHWWPPEPQTWDHPGAYGEVEIVAIKGDNGQFINTSDLTEAELAILSERASEKLGEED
jgi:hypothetical protein